MNVEKKRAFIINCLYYAILGGAIYFGLKYGVPVMLPFIIGFVIAYLLRKPIRLLNEKLHINRRGAAAITVALFYLTIGTLVSLLLIKLASSVGTLIRYLPSFYTSQIKPILTDILYFLENLEEMVDPQVVLSLENLVVQGIEALGKAVSNFSVWALSWVSNTAFSVPGAIISFFLVIISSFFIAMDYDVIVGFFTKQLKDNQSELLKEIKDYVVGTLFMCIRSYAIIMTLTFIELSIGLTLIGIDNAVIIALMISVFDILPVLGTGGIMIPWGLIMIISGRFGLGIGLLGIYLAITVIRNIVEPKIVGAQLGLHPVLTLASMVAGVNFFGVIGLFGFPIILSLLKNLNEKGVIKLYK